MFGGAQFSREAQGHFAVDERLWLFNFHRLEWSALSSLQLPRPTYFHAAAMNKVRIVVLNQTAIRFV
jgi:hypothetical protein